MIDTGEREREREGEREEVVVFVGLGCNALHQTHLHRMFSIISFRYPVPYTLYNADRTFTGFLGVICCSSTASVFCVLERGRPAVCLQ